MRVRTAARQGRRWATVVVATAIGALVGAAPALADTSVTEGPMTLTVSQAEKLPLTGGTITVSGKGYDPNKGIYVAVCVDNGPGKTPTPCLGGVDMTGEAGASAWISSNPPSYAEGLTTPYGPGGTFSLDLAVVAVDPVTGVDCTTVGCSVVTRADHTRPSDRSLDVRIPLTFSATGTVTGPPTTTRVTKKPTTTAPTRSESATGSATTAPPTARPTSSVPATPTPATSAPATSGTPTSSSSPAPTSSISDPSATPSSSAGSPSAAESTAPVDAAAATTDVGSGSGWIGWVVGGAVLAALIGAGIWWSRRSSADGAR